MNTSLVVGEFAAGRRSRENRKTKEWRKSPKPMHLPRPAHHSTSRSTFVRTIWRIGLWVAAAEVGENGVSVLVESPPMLLISWLAIETVGVWLPRLVERLEVENVEVPVESSTHALFVEFFGVLGPGHGRARLGGIVVVGSAFKLSQQGT